MTAMLSSKKIATSHSVNQDEPPPTENDENESVEGELYSGEIMIEELLPTATTISPSSEWYQRGG